MSKEQNRLITSDEMDHFETLYLDLGERVANVVRQVWLDDGLARSFELAGYRDGHASISLDGRLAAKIPYGLLLNPSPEGVEALREDWLANEARIQEAAVQRAQELVDQHERQELARLKEKFDGGS